MESEEMGHKQVIFPNAALECFSAGVLEGTDAKGVQVTAV
jgi:hypothetical protein